MLTEKRFYRLRTRAFDNAVGEDECEEMLTELGCVKVRDACVIPAVYMGKGKMMNELTMFHLLASKIHNAGIEVNTSHRFGYERMPSDESIRKVVDAFRLKRMQCRTYMPSVWSYEPKSEDTIPKRMDIPCRIIGYDD